MTATVPEAPQGPLVGPTPASVAESLAEPGLDMRSARGVVETRARRRLRVRRGIAGGAAAVVAIALVGALLVRDDTGEVVADRDRDPSTTTTTSPASTTTAAPVTVPVTSLVTTTTIRPATTVPVTAPTTVPPPVNQPMQLTVVPVTDRIEAGRTAAVQINWSDPDFADPAGPRITSVWGDPLVGFPIDAGGGAPCDLPGPGSSGTRLLEFRYTTPGTYTVNIEVSGCGGQGAFAESRTLTTQLTVLEPVDATVLVASSPSLTRRPDAAKGYRYPGGVVPAPGSEELAEARVPELDQIALGLPGGPATVLRFGDAVDGDVVELRWDDGACAWGVVEGGAVELDTAAGCYDPATGTGSTTVPPG